MKIHLERVYTVTVKGLACTNNMFAKGRAVSADEFKTLPDDLKCKRCATLNQTKTK